jgi:hypothetical protein
MSRSVSTKSLLQGLAPEAQLLARCAQVQPSPLTQEHLRRLLGGTLDWARVLQLAHGHGIEPLLRQHLASHRDALPAEVLSKLESRARRLAVRNLQQTHELMRLVAGLEDNDIPVIPFKGPMLAALAYGDVAFRPFVDLDVLVCRDDVLRAKTFLQQEGYAPVKDMDPADEKAYVDTQLGYEFVHPGRRTIVELHWAFFYEIYAFDLAPKAVWARHRTAKVAGMTVRTLAPEDLLLYLCTHGTKHRWVQLKWIADVAEHVRASPDMDWTRVKQQAEEMGVRRMLCLGLWLAHTLLDADLPTLLVNEARRSRPVQAMAQQVCDEWLFPAPGTTPPSDWEIFRFHLKERERWRDRWPYVKHHLDLWLG